MQKKKTYLNLFIVLLVCCMLTSCNWMTGKKVNAINNTIANQQFCYLFYDQLKNDTRAMMFDYCYAYLITADHVGANWYWINPALLNTKLSEQINDEMEIETEAISTTTKLIANMPVVYLTFDDGPGKYTDRVLDILKEENIKATFFVVGVQVERNPLFSARIIDEGHTIGNHTYDHDYKAIYSDFQTMAEQIIATNRIIYELTEERITLFRAPGGSINNFDAGYFSALREAGFKLFDWNVDSRDSVTRGILHEEIIANIKEQPLYDPAIVLLHDTNTHEQSMLALRDVIAYYRDQGYQFAQLTPYTEELTFRLGSNLKWEREEVSDEQIEWFKEEINQLYPN